MIDAKDIILRRKDEHGLNVSENTLPKYKGTVGAITTDEQFEELVQYIINDAKIVGINEKPFVLEEEPSKIGNIRKPFIINLPPFEPVIFKFS